MGRPPSNGGPSFRFNQSEIAEMEAILQAHKTAMPAREVLVSLAEKFSNSEERSGKIEVQMKQVWNWFQNRRYAIRAKAAKSPGKLNITPMTRDDSVVVKGVPQATPPHAASSATVRSLPQASQHPTGPSVRTFPQAPQHPATFSVQSAGRVVDNSQMEYEAKSARDGAWYDVSTFLSHRSLETGDPEVLVRFAGFGAEEDEWVNVRKNVRQRSLPCESSECVAVLPADLILCFQEGKEQALYFDAHVLDAQRRRHDVRGCRCRFLVRYDHDQSEEIVALRKICRRPETDYRLQQLHAINESLSANQNKAGANNIHTVSTLRVYPPAEVQPKQHKVEPVVPSPSPAEVPQKRQRVDSAVSAPLPEGSQKQFKVEPATLAPPGDVYTVQPVVPAPSPDMPQYHHTVQSVLPAPSPQQLPELQNGEPMVPSPSTQASLEPQKVETLVPVLSAEDSVESQNIESAIPSHTNEEPLGSQKVQAVVPDPSTEASVERHEAENMLPFSGEVKEELQTVGATVVAPLTEASQEHCKAEPAPSREGSQEPQTVEPAVPPPSAEAVPAVPPPPAEAVQVPVEPHKVELEVTEQHKEPMVPCPSADAPEESHESQPNVPDQPRTSVLEQPETTLEDPVMPTTNDPEAIEAQTQQQPELSVPMDSNEGNVHEDKHAKAAEAASNDKVWSSDLPPETATGAAAAGGDGDNVTGDSEEG